MYTSGPQHTEVAKPLHPQNQTPYHQAMQDAARRFQPSVASMNVGVPGAVMPSPIANPYASGRPHLPPQSNAHSYQKRTAAPLRHQPTPPTTMQRGPSGPSHLNPTRNRTIGSGPLSKKPDPLPPFCHITTLGQARATTYPSRMRLGVTSLVQPLGPSGFGAGAAPPAGTVLGKRQRTAVNYAELENIDDALDEETSSEADSSYMGGTSRSRALAAKKAAESARSTPGPSTPSSDTKKPADLGKTYLGQTPPPNSIWVEPARKTQHAYPPEDFLAANVDKKAIFVPIRVEFDTETHRIRDCFVWNAGDAFLTPDTFAIIFCEDLGLFGNSPSGMPYRQLVAQSIRSQVEEFQGVAEIDIVPEDQEAERAETDLRVIVNIDVQIQTIHLVDRIEWDLTSPLTPELFAKQLCAELGLTGEALPIISHAIHEELLRHKKECLEAGIFGNQKDSAGEDQNVDFRGPRKLEGVWRDLADVATFGPRVEVLTPDDIVGLEVEAERANKRLRNSMTKNPHSRTGGSSRRR